MRHTLLPLNERKALRREYHVRLLTVFCILLCSSGIIGIGSLFPAYIRALGEEKTQLDAAAKLKRSQDVQGVTAVQDQLKADNKFVTLLAKDLHHIRISAILGSIISLRQNIRLTAFNFNQPSTTTVSIDMQGRAATRADLLSFKGRLENTLLGAKIDLPIGELAKSTNIDFSLKVSYRPL